MSMPIIPASDLEGETGALPPHDDSAEMVVLGAMLSSRDAIDEVADLLDPDDFYRGRHRAIYEAILALHREDRPTDAVSVGGELERRGEFLRVGAAPYLHTLIESCPSAANVAYHAERVQEKATARKLVEYGGLVAAHAAQPGADPQEALSGAYTRMIELVEQRHRRGVGPRMSSDLVCAAMDELDEIASGSRTGLSTGLMDLDALLGGGFLPGQMITVAARPGVGKSVLATDFARAAALRQGQGVLIYSLEMSATEITHRMLAAESSVNIGAMRSGHLSDEDWVRLARRQPALAEAPLAVDDTALITPVEMLSRARQVDRQLRRSGQELGLIIVDYLQLMTSGRRAENRQTEVSEISRSMKLMAKQLEVPVVAISQLNRGPEQRTDKKPQLSDLRESGSIEQDSDVVILIHRPDAFDQDDPRMGEADLIVAKHRGGPTGTVTVAHQLHYSRFVDMAPEPQRRQEVGQA